MIDDPLTDSDVARQDAEEEARFKTLAERRYYRTLAKHPDPRDPAHPEPPWQMTIPDYL